MSIEFLIAAAETYEKKAIEAERAGNVSAAIKYRNMAAKKYNDAAQLNPHNKEELSFRAEELKKSGVSVDSSSGAAQFKPADNKNPQPSKFAERDNNAERNRPVEPQILEQALAQLNSLIGLKEVKERVNSLVNQCKANVMRREYGLPTVEMSNHLVFVGNPGTGKTTVARIMGQIYRALNIVSKGHLVEVTRGDLVAEYVGQTAPKTQKVIESAMGGVLFIDEAYSLVQGGRNDFGREAIDTIMVAMENNRADLAVIVAGYEVPMKKFFNSNPGLSSRFKMDRLENGNKLPQNYIRFTDYNGEELFLIFKGICSKNGYVLSDSAEKLMRQYLYDFAVKKIENFGNGRTVRNIFEAVIEKQSTRIVSCGEINKEKLMEITQEDLPI